MKCLAKINVLTTRKQEQEALCKKIASDLKDIQSKEKNKENFEIEKRLTEDLFGQACGARYFADELKDAQEEMQKALEEVNALLAVKEHLPDCPVLNSAINSTAPHMGS